MDNNNLESYGNKNLHDEAISKLYSGNDLEEVLEDENIKKYIFYDVPDIENELIPVGLIVSCNGEKEDMVNVLREDIGERLSIENSLVSDRVNEVEERVREKLFKVGRFVYIKDMYMKEDCDIASRKITFGVKEILNTWSSSVAICLVGKENNVISLLDKKILKVELLDELGDFKVWYIEI